MIILPGPIIYLLSLTQTNILSKEKIDYLEDFGPKDICGQARPIFYFIGLTIDRSA